MHEVMIGFENRRNDRRDINHNVHKENTHKEHEAESYEAL